MQLRALSNTGNWYSRKQCCSPKDGTDGFATHVFLEDVLTDYQVLSVVVENRNEGLYPDDQFEFAARLQDGDEGDQSILEFHVALASSDETGVDDGRGVVDTAAAASVSGDVWTDAYVKICQDLGLGSLPLCPD